MEDHGDLHYIALIGQGQGLLTERFSLEGHQQDCILLGDVIEIFLMVALRFTDQLLETSSKEVWRYVIGQSLLRLSNGESTLSIDLIVDVLDLGHNELDT